MAKKLNWNGTEIGARASAVTYENQQSGMAANNVQSAIDELKAAIGSGGSSGGGSYAPYAGKRMGIFGDSFTAGGQWIRRMKELLPGLIVNNKAVSGARWGSSESMDSQSKSIIQQLRNYYADCVANNYWPDYLLMVNGLNNYNDDISSGDYSVNYLGTIKYTQIDDVTHDVAGDGKTAEENYVDYLKSVFCVNGVAGYTAGMQLALSYAAVKFPNANIVIGFTPNGQDCVYQFSSHTGWEPFFQYIDRMKTIATMYGAKYINTTNTDICSWITSRKQLYRGYNGTDGHPSADGYNRIGEHMAKILMSELW